MSVLSSRIAITIVITTMKRLQRATPPSTRSNPMRTSSRASSSERSDRSRAHGRCGARASNFTRTSTSTATRPRPSQATRRAAHRRCPNPRSNAPTSMRWHARGQERVSRSGKPQREHRPQVACRLHPYERRVRGRQWRLHDRARRFFERRMRDRAVPGTARREWPRAVSAAPHPAGQTVTLR